MFDINCMNQYDGHVAFHNQFKLKLVTKTITDK